MKTVRQFLAEADAVVADAEPQLAGVALLELGVVPQILSLELPEASLFAFFLISELPEILVQTGIPDWLAFESWATLDTASFHVRRVSESIATRSLLAFTLRVIRPRRGKIAEPIFHLRGFGVHR
jgi:hypothetical protein